MSAVFSFIIGLVAWTFTEYAMHNWNGHMSKGRLAFSREHLAHHAQFDYVSPLGAKLRTAVPLLSAVYGIGWLFAGAWLGLVFTAGLSVGYLAYSWLHHDLHISAPRTAYGRWARRHHFHHHFADSSTNHGVTSPIWDWVFGTYRDPGVVQVPKSRMMPWLEGDEAGTIAEQFAADYQLKVRTRREAA